MCPLFVRASVLYVCASAVLGSCATLDTAHACCSLEAALASPTIPPEIVTSLLNLAEFMEHDDKQLPLDTRTLGALAEKCHAFAKALHYKVCAHVSVRQPTGRTCACCTMRVSLARSEA